MKRPPITCPKCGYVFTPRVDKPRKCANPRCQHPLNYPEPKS